MKEKEVRALREALKAWITKYPEEAHNQKAERKFYDAYIMIANIIITPRLGQTEKEEDRTQ